MKLFFDIMSKFNDNLKNIKVKNLVIFIIIVYLVLYVLGRFSLFIDEKWLYVFIIFYFVFILRDSFFDFKEEALNVFSKIQLRYILLVVFANIFFSYGMLYLSNAIVNYFPVLGFLVEFSIPSMSLTDQLPIVGAFISTVIISPISEELIFRGVLINRLRLITPLIFAVLVSSLLFAALHSFGSIISAFVFAICMAILYIKTDNICVPILAHFLNNLFAEIICYIDCNELLFTNDLVMAVMSILAMISFVIILSSIKKEWNRIK